MQNQAEYRDSPKYAIMDINNPNKYYCRVFKQFIPIKDGYTIREWFDSEEKAYNEIKTNFKGSVMFTIVKFYIIDL